MRDGVRVCVGVGLGDPLLVEVRVDDDVEVLVREPVGVRLPVAEEVGELVRVGEKVGVGVREENKLAHETSRKAWLLVSITSTRPDPVTVTPRRPENCAQLPIPLANPGTLEPAMVATCAVVERDLMRLFPASAT